MRHFVNWPFQPIQPGHGHDQRRFRRDDRLMRRRGLHRSHARAVGFDEHTVYVGPGQQAGRQVGADTAGLLAVHVADDKTAAVGVQQFPQPGEVIGVDNGRGQPHLRGKDARGGGDDHATGQRHGQGEQQARLTAPADEGN